MLVEPNDLIAANNTLVGSQEIQSTVIGNINPESDVDLYQFQLDTGEGITLDLDADEFDSSLDSVLRLFDADGNELGINDDRPAPEEIFSLDSYLTFIANTPGEYYVGVSSVNNLNYDPLAIDNDSNDIDDDTSRNYALEINIVEVVAEEDPDDTIGEAIATKLDTPGDSDTFSDEIDVGKDIDIYQLQLSAGDGLILDIDAAEFDSNLDSQLRLFDQNGIELASSDDNPASEEEFSSDSYLSYTAEIDGAYYVGVSTAGNADYDAINGRTNLFQNDSTNSGSYDLNIDIVEIDSDEDPDNTIAEANFNLEEDTIAIEDSIDSLGDVDVFGFYLDSGKTVTVDLDAAELSTGLDSVLILFDKLGNEIERNDDGAAPGEDPFLIDSYIQFTADVAGTYYVGVSGFPNLDYDVINGSDNLGFNQDFSIGDYELAINALDNLVGTDESDTLSGYATNTLIQGLQSDDTITGGENNDYLVGNSGNDALSGNKGDDTLIGGTGLDTISGGSGSDVLQGNNGDNVLRGGPGSDIFVLIKTNLTEDTILDFEDGVDKILLGNDYSFDDIEIEDFTSDVGVTLIDENGNAIAQVIGVSASNFSEDDFVIELNSNEI